MTNEQIKLLEGLLDLAVDNATQDLNDGKYLISGTSAAFALIIESEFQELVELSGQFNMKKDSVYMAVKAFFEDNLEDAMLGD